jgi:hypothetical protein
MSTMNNYFTDHFEEATLPQLERLLKIVDEGGEKNWGWLLSWVNGRAPNIFRDDDVDYESTAENVLRLFEKQWDW